MISFPTNKSEILDRLDSFEPVDYALSRNYKNGTLSYLSPYISRGFLTTKKVYEFIKARGYSFSQVEKYVQELAWRDYWQLNWKYRKGLINTHSNLVCNDRPSRGIPSCIINASTGIYAVDEAIQTLYTTGYMHNHMRMYVASICCNIANVHWLEPAKWLYSNLLDADIATNSLSWQWIAGINSSKKYFANQDNINRFFDSDQKGTFLDTTYDKLTSMNVPDILRNIRQFNFKTDLSSISSDEIDDKDTLVYNFYNLDPDWYSSDLEKQRILLLEPSFFSKYPVKKNVLEFFISLASNIQDLKIFIGEFAEMKEKIGNRSTVFFKEHPCNEHYEGVQEPRDWLSSVQDEYPSFFKFWKRVKNDIH